MMRWGQRWDMMSDFARMTDSSGLFVRNTLPFMRSFFRAFLVFFNRLFVITDHLLFLSLFFVVSAIACITSPSIYSADTFWMLREDFFFSFMTTCLSNLSSCVQDCMTTLFWEDPSDNQRINPSHEGNPVAIFKTRIVKKHLKVYWYLFLISKSLNNILSLATWPLPSSSTGHHDDHQTWDGMRVVSGSDCLLLPWLRSQEVNERINEMRKCRASKWERRLREKKQYFVSWSRGNFQLKWWKRSWLSLENRVMMEDVMDSVSHVRETDSLRFCHSKSHS